MDMRISCLIFQFIIHIFRALTGLQSLLQSLKQNCRKSAQVYIIEKQPSFTVIQYCMARQDYIGKLGKFISYLLELQLKKLKYNGLRTFQTRVKANRSRNASLQSDKVTYIKRPSIFSRLLHAKNKTESCFCSQRYNQLKNVALKKGKICLRNL